MGTTLNGGCPSLYIIYNVKIAVKEFLLFANRCFSAANINIKRYAHLCYPGW